MTFETERCIVKPMSRKDKKDLHRLCDDENVWTYLGGQKTASNNKKKIKFIGFIPVIPVKNRWAVRRKTDNAFLGEICLAPHHDGDMEVSYLFISEHRGNGYACEAVEAFVHHVFSSKKLNRLVAETQSANLASCKMLEKLGFHKVKTLMRFDAEQALYAIDNRVV